MPFTALNGRLPDALLTHLPWPEAAGFRLRIDAAASAGRLAAAFYARFAAPLRLTDAYRTFASQVDLKASKGVWAATPGTSNHGLGIAIDFASGINVDGSPQHLWMVANAGRFGWVNPTWATDWNPSNGQHEPWHWEYHPELDITPAIPALAATPAAIPALPTIQEDDDMNIERALQAAYRQQIGRTPSDGELDDRIVRIALDQSTLAGEITGIDKSVESNRYAVSQLYREILGRPASTAEADFWIKSSGNDLAKIRTAVAGSPEAKARK